MNGIIFFNGWGMDEKIVSHLKIPQNFEFVCINFPYRLDTGILQKYKSLYFIGWSFGVFYMADFISKNYKFLKDKINYTAVINGIPYLMQKNILDKRVIVLTYKNLNRKNLEFFYLKSGIKNYITDKSIDELKAELKYFTEVCCPVKINIDRAFISSNDMIVKTEIQKKYYEENKIPFTIMEGKHCIFDKIDEWRYFLGR